MNLLHVISSCNPSSGGPIEGVKIMYKHFKKVGINPEILCSDSPKMIFTKNKDLPKMCVFLIEQFFYNLVKDNENRIDFLLNIKLFIIKKINDFITYNLNVNTVIKSIELKINNVRQ